MEEGKIKVTINGVEHEWKATRSGPIQVSEGTIEVAGETWKASSVMPLPDQEMEIDYDVEWDGETFRRVCYGEKDFVMDLEPVEENQFLDIGFNEADPNKAVIHTDFNYGETNMDLEVPQPDAYLAYYYNSGASQLLGDEIVLFPGKFAMSFWRKTKEGKWYYLQFFLISEAGTTALSIADFVDGELRFQNPPEDLGWDDAPIKPGDSIYFYWPKEVKGFDWKGDTPYIPEKQPLVPVTPKIDYDVEYGGVTYERWGYNGLKQYAYIDDESAGIKIGFKNEDKNIWAADNLSFASEANLPKVETNYYINWQEGDWNLPNKKICFSFWEIDDDGFIYYHELFYNPDSEDKWEDIRTIFDPTKAYESQDVFTDQDAFAAFEWYSGQKIYFYEADLGITWPSEVERTIPAVQPFLPDTPPPEPEIDYDVEYDGIAFRRYGYNDLRQYLKTKPDAFVTGDFIGFRSSKNVWVADDLQWLSETNLDQEETEFYYEINSTVYFEENAAFSFFIKNDDGLVNYYEFFVKSSEIYKVISWEWNSDGSLSDRYVTTSIRINLDGDESLYFYDYRTDLDWSGGTRYIPAVQPYK